MADLHFTFHRHRPSHWFIVPAKLWTRGTLLRQSDLSYLDRYDEYRERSDDSPLWGANGTLSGLGRDRLLPGLRDAVRQRRKQPVCALSSVVGRSVEPIMNRGPNTCSEWPPGDVPGQFGNQRGAAVGELNRWASLSE